MQNLSTNTPPWPTRLKTSPQKRLTRTPMCQVGDAELSLPPLKPQRAPARLDLAAARTVRGEHSSAHHMHHAHHMHLHLHTAKQRTAKQQAAQSTIFPLFGTTISSPVHANHKTEMLCDAWKSKHETAPHSLAEVQRDTAWEQLERQVAPCGSESSGECRPRRGRASTSPGKRVLRSPGVCCVAAGWARGAKRGAMIQQAAGVKRCLI